MPYAPGIEDKQDMGDPTELSVGSFVPYVVQEHLARRAGPHQDIRIGKDRMLSWASRKGVPEPGQKALAIQQPVHSEDYADFQGEIPEGYGAGEVRTADRGEALITRADADRISAVLASKKRPIRLNLIKTPKGWLLNNSTPDKPIQQKKVHYKTAEPDELEKFYTPDWVFSPKVDGAAAFYPLEHGKAEALSYRADSEGRPIVHTERAGLENVRTAARGLLRGELFGERKGRSISPQELGGLLNSTLLNSRKEQEARGIALKSLIFNALQEKGKEIPISAPFDMRLAALQRLTSDLPTDQFVLPEFMSGEQARPMVNRIFGGKDPLTHEGVVIWPRKGGVPYKVKSRPEYDVRVQGAYPGKRPGDYGGLTYSLPGSDKVVGKVGTGFSAAQRKTLQELVGRIARIRAQGQFPSGAYRAPSFIAAHEG